MQMNTSLPAPQEKCLRLIMDRSKAIHNKQYLDDIFHFITMVATHVTHMKRCTLWLLDRDEMPAKMRLCAAHSIDPAVFEHHILGLNEGVVGLVATRKSPVIIEDVATHSIFKEKKAAKALNLVSLLSVPMMTADSNLTGVLNCYTTCPHQFNKNEIDLMCSVGNQGAAVAFKVELMLRNQIIQAEIDNLQTIKQASALLCKQRNINAREAVGWMKKCSINSCRSVRHVAEAILISKG